MFNNDCLEVMKNMPDNIIDLIVTDPPYEICTTGAGLYKQEDKQYVKELNEMSNGFLPEVLDEMCRIMKKINIYFFCSQKQILPLLDYFVAKKKCNYNLISWHKTNPIPACGNKYLTDTEFVLFFRDRGVKIYGEFKSKFTYYVTPLNQSDKKKYHHPTIKPLNIVENFIINSSTPKQIVFDPFVGSGTTGVAALKNDRRFIGCELKQEYCETTVKRLEESACFNPVEEQK